MATVDQKVSRIECALRVIAVGDQRVTEINKKQQQRRGTVAAAIESLVLDLARESGLLNLPPRQIKQVLGGLKDACAALAPPVASAKSPITITKVAKATKGAKASRPAAAGKKPRRSRGPRSSSAAKDGVHVVLHKGGNVTAAPALRDAGLHWNGKFGHWHGDVTVAAAATLRGMFPNEFETDAPLAPPVAGATPVETVSQTAAADGTSTTADAGLLDQAGAADTGGPVSPPPPPVD